MLLMISQFIAFFNYSQLPNVLAIGLSEWLEHAGIGALPLLIGLILVIVVLDLIMPGLVPKWAIFAPIFVPLFIQLGVPAADGARRLSRRRLAVQRRDAADGLPAVHRDHRAALPEGRGHRHHHRADAALRPIILLVVWIILFVVWYLLGLPLGPGYPVPL